MPVEDTTMGDLIDRRRSPRIPCNLSVEYQVTGARTHDGRMANIGTGGGLLTTQGPIPPVGAGLLLRFHLPLSNRPVQAAGNVRWGNQGTAGVEFLHLNLQEQDEIWRYYARELARQRDLDAWRQIIRQSEPPPD